MHKMPIVVDSSQEFGTAITPLMEPALSTGGEDGGGSVGSSTPGQRGGPSQLWRFVSFGASSPLIRESARFTYRAGQIYDPLRANEGRRRLLRP